MDNSQYTQLMSSLISEVQTMLMLIPLSTQQWAHFKPNPGTRQMETLTQRMVPVTIMSKVIWPFSYLEVGVGNDRR